MAVAQAKEGIEKELTCPLCLEIFTDPKRLPCDHIYCKDPCLKGLVLRSLNSTITCPECRTVAQVPHYDVNIFPTAFQINRLKELYRNMQKADSQCDDTHPHDETDSSRSPEKQTESATTTCAAHASQPIALYCETCEEVLCRDCVLKSDKHKEHNYGYIEEVADIQRKATMNQLVDTKVLESQLSTALEGIAREKANVMRQEQAHSDQIDATFEAIINALAKERKRFKSTVSRKSHQKQAALARQEENLSVCLHELSDTIEQVENSVRSESSKDTACNKRKHVQRLQQASSKVGDPALTPTEKADLGLCLTPPGKVVSRYKKGNYQYSLTAPHQRNCILGGFESFETGRRCTAALQITDTMGRKSSDKENIQVEVHCIRDNLKICGEVIQSATGNYIISVTPQTRGRHKISVKVNNSHIAASPISIIARVPPQQLDKPVSTITDIDHPAGLCCFEDKLYVTASSCKISVLNESREKIRTHTLPGVYDFTIDSETGDWFVTDTSHHRLYKHDKHGRLVKSVGGRGASPEHFDFPNGIQISRDGEIFVCDTGNHRIKVYDKELDLLQVIGEQGTKKGFFRGPVNSAFSSSGDIFVTEEGNNRVQVLSPDGKTIRIIGQLGNKPGEFSCPTGIVINGSYVYITEANNKRISVFTTQGEFVTTFGGDCLHRPECIAIDRDGYVYVSDNQEKVVVF